VDAFAATRLAAGTACLLFAAGSDLRTRRVTDRLWVAIGSFGLLLLCVQTSIVSGSGTLIANIPPSEVLALVGCSAILFYAIFFGPPLFGEEGFRFRPLRVIAFLAAAALFVFPAASYLGSGRTLPRAIVELYPAPAMVLVYQGFYMARILHGGADAKGLIALTLLVPTYPDASPFPLIAPNPIVQDLLRVAFPFSLVIYVDAAILFLAVPVVLFLRNAIRGDFGLPQAFLGYRTPIQRIPSKAWLMERINDRGEHILVLFPKRGGDRSEDIARLRAAGIDRVWVTPQIPFMVPLLGGFWLAFFVGNVLLGIFGPGR
jgi:preflagellin peptidase FlaK